CRSPRPRMARSTSSAPAWAAPPSTKPGSTKPRAWLSQSDVLRLCHVEGCGQAGLAQIQSQKMADLKKARRPRTKEGDIFVIAVDDNRYAAGQVLLKDVSFPIYAAFFAPLWPQGEDLDLQKITSSEILLVGGTADALIWHGN